MKKVQVCFAGVLSMLVASESNADYSAEVSTGYAYTYGDDSSEDDAFLMSGAVFFKPVKVGSNPWAEAAFMDRASNLNVGYVDSFDFNRAGIGVEIEYFADDAPFFAQAGVSTTKSPGEDYEARWLSVGGFPFDNLLIHGAFARSLRGESSTDIYGPLAKYVLDVGGFSLNIEGGAQQVRISSDSDSSVDEDETGTSNSLYGDIYISSRFSVGGGYTALKVEGDKTDTIEFRTRVFFNEDISLSASYKITEFDDDADEDAVNVLSVSVNYRFGSEKTGFQYLDEQGRKREKQREETTACDERYKELFPLCG